MLQHSYPGVYVQEIPSGPRPITATATSTALFVGQTEMGPDVPQHITSWNEYLRLFGGFGPGPSHQAYLPHGVLQFFNNGGRTCYVLRLVGQGAKPASIVVGGQDAHEGRGAISFSAKTPGRWGNDVLISVARGTLDTENDIRIEVRRIPKGTLEGALDEEEIAALPVLEAHDNLSLHPEHPRFIQRVLERHSLFVSVVVQEVIDPGPAVYRGRVFDDLDQLAVRLEQLFGESGGSSDLFISVDGAPFRKVTLSQPNPPPVDADEVLELLERAIGNRFPEGNVSVARSPNNDALELQSNNPDPKMRSVVVQEGSPLARALGFEGGQSRLFSPYRTRRPRFTAAEGGNYQSDVPYRLGRAANGVSNPVTGEDGAPPRLDDELGKLDAVTDASLLVAPGGASDVFNTCVAYCERRPLRDLFFIGDVPRDDDSVDKALDVRLRRVMKPNALGALYFPWVKAKDPSGATAEVIELPPSGFVAGVYARIDATRGVWKAPAGLEASLSGAVGLGIELSDAQQGRLNLAGVNVIRKFPLGGLVVWGARTVTSDPRQQYISIRRTQSMIQRSVYEGLQAAVFEPNNDVLWSSLRADVGAFMNTLFRAGAFQGETAREAYFVRCGLGDPMTQADIDRGIVIVDVGFAPLKPAEFVVVRVQQQLSVG